MAGRVTHFRRLKQHGYWKALSSRFTRWSKSLLTSLPLATLTDLGRSKSQLIAENALLRKPLIILKRQVKRPTFTRTDRLLLVLLARLVRTWVQRFTVMDNSYISPNRLTALSTRLILASQGALHAPHFTQRGAVWPFICTCSRSWSSSFSV
jgi:hypothetical protein